MRNLLKLIILSVILFSATVACSRSSDESNKIDYVEFNISYLKDIESVNDDHKKRIENAINIIKGKVSSPCPQVVDAGYVVEGNELLYIAFSIVTRSEIGGDVQFWVNDLMVEQDCYCESKIRNSDEPYVYSFVYDKDFIDSLNLDHSLINDFSIRLIPSGCSAGEFVSLYDYTGVWLPRQR